MMRTKRNKWIIVLLIILLISLITGGFALHYYKTHYITASLQEREQNEVTDILNRPECGWFQLYSYYLKPGTALTADECYFEAKDSSNYEYRLSLVEINLAEYAKSSLDLSAVNNIRTVFELFQRTNSKIILRFLYDWDGNGLEKEPDSRQMIMKHMKEVAPLLNEYKDIIYTTQGIFIGSWAEMHDSKYLSVKDMTTLLLYYASQTDNSIYLAVRTPKQYQDIMKELEKNSADYTKYHVSIATLKKRLGLFNDGILGSLSDLGTYSEVDDVTKSAEERKALRDKALLFQNTLCKSVPNGGEVLGTTDAFLRKPKNAVKALQTMHISYLNQMYDDKVITQWKNTVYQDSDSIFDGFSTYDYITAHLGARFVLRKTTLSYKPFQTGDAKGSLTIENVGFSTLYSAKNFTLCLINADTKQETVLVTNNTVSTADTTKWYSQNEITIPFHFSPFDYEDGSYKLYARLSDPVTGENIPFANDSYHTAQNGYLLGTITIQR